MLTYRFKKYYVSKDEYENHKYRTKLLNIKDRKELMQPKQYMYYFPKNSKWTDGWFLHGNGARRIWDVILKPQS